MAAVRCSLELVYSQIVVFVNRLRRTSRHIIKVIMYKVLFEQNCLNLIYVNVICTHSYSYILFINKIQLLNAINEK